MKIEPGLIVVIAATLIFYLRLIIIQRQRAKQAALPLQKSNQSKKKRQKSTGNEVLAPTKSYSILSPRRSDWFISGIGFLAIVTGILMNQGLLFSVSMQPYWWGPTSAGIIAFSWAFRL